MGALLKQFPGLFGAGIAAACCLGINNCKGKGWLNTSAADCSLKGGVPLKGSPADPERG